MLFLCFSHITLHTQKEPRNSLLEDSVHHVCSMTGNGPCACHGNQYLSAPFYNTSPTQPDLSLPFNVFKNPKLKTLGIRNSLLSGGSAACSSSSISVCYGNTHRNSATVFMGTATRLGLEQKHRRLHSLIIFFFVCANS